MPNVIIEHLLNANITRAHMIKNGFSAQKYDDVCRGKSTYKISDIIEMSEKFQLSLDYLITGKDSNITRLSQEEQELLTFFNQLSAIDKGKVIGKAEGLLEQYSSYSPNNSVTQTSSKCSKDSKIETRTMFIPIFELPVSAGTGIFLDAESTEPLKVVRTAASETANYALRVSGDSMEPEYSNGDIVLVETVENVSEGEIGIFIADGEGFMKVRGAEALISLNAEYLPRSYASFESVKCIGRVLGKAELV